MVALLGLLMAKNFLGPSAVLFWYEESINFFGLPLLTLFPATTSSTGQGGAVFHLPPPVSSAGNKSSKSRGVFCKFIDDFMLSVSQFYSSLGTNGSDFVLIKTVDLILSPPPLALCLAALWEWTCWLATEKRGSCNFSPSASWTGEIGCIFKYPRALFPRFGNGFLLDKRWRWREDIMDSEWFL